LRNFRRSHLTLACVGRPGPLLCGCGAAGKLFHPLSCSSLIHASDSMLSAYVLSYVSILRISVLHVTFMHSSLVLFTCRPLLQLGVETIKASDHVRLLGVTISSDLSLDKHMSIMFNVLLLASPDPSNTSIYRHRLHSDSCTRFHCVSS